MRGPLPSLFIWLVPLLQAAGCERGGFREPGPTTATTPARPISWRGDAAQPADSHDATALADAPRALVRPPPARNVILFVGDGMGPVQVEAARRFANGNTAPLAMETLPFHARMLTRNALGTITDSAAGATAFATGHKVRNEIISLATPGGGQPLVTALELRQARGAATGLITRETSILDATPAAFFAHQSSRYASEAIARDLFGVARPDFLAAEAANHANNAVAVAAGYIGVVGDWDSAAMAGLVPGSAKLAWFYDREAPSLAGVTSAALNFLDRTESGFFLMVENEGTDTGGHAHDLQHVVAAVLELDKAVAAAIAWQAGRTDTLIVVTADHETGGLSLGDEPGEAGVLPRHNFSDYWHTATPVPVFGGGVGASVLPANLENTDLFWWLAP